MREVKKRILWVDIAKAIAILSVIISHTLELDMTLRVMLFSFHMPLFFILSGFTTTLATDKKTFLKRLKKNFKNCIIPTIVILVLFAIIISFIKTPSGPIGRDGGISMIFSNLKYAFYNFFLAIHPDSGLMNASAVWFLVVLFGAKTIMDFINVNIKSEKNGLIFIILGMIGVCMGVFQRLLPSYIDLMLVASMFIEIGILWRKYEKTVKKYTVPLLIIAVVFWFSQIMRGVYLEMWLRFYAGYEVSILTAIAGSFIVSNLAMALEEALKKSGKILKKGINILVFIGKNSFLLYMVHCLDVCLLENIWDLRDGTRGRLVLTILLRLGLNLLIFACLHFIYKKIRSARHPLV